MIVAQEREWDNVMVATPSGLLYGIPMGIILEVVLFLTAALTLAIILIG